MSDPLIRKRPVPSVRYELCRDARPADDAHWIWPLPRLAGQAPRIIAHANDDRLGVDIGYERFAFADLFVPVFAVGSGTVSFAAHVTSGWAVTIDHGRWSTHYAHLEQMFVMPTLGRRRRRARVHAGDVIGYASRSPTHVRFELWRWTSRDGFVPAEVAPKVRDWLCLPQFDQRVYVPKASPMRRYASNAMS